LLLLLKLLKDLLLLVELLLVVELVLLLLLLEERRVELLVAWLTNRLGPRCWSPRGVPKRYCCAA